MQLPEHRIFVGTDMDDFCTDFSKRSVIETYARQLLSPESNIKSSDTNIMKAAQVAYLEVERLAKRARIDAWEVPEGLVPMQSFPPHIVEYLCQYHVDRSLYDMRGLSMNKWTPTWIQRVNEADVCAMRTYEAKELGLVIRKSSIKHPEAGLGVYAARGFKKDERIGWYYGTLVYGDLGLVRRHYKTYGTGVLGISTKDFDKWAIQLEKTFVDINDVKYDGWVVGAPFCACRYINDPRYRIDDPEAKTKKPRTANAKVTHKKACLGNKDFEIYDCVQVTATRDIAMDEEIFMPYGAAYLFPSTSA